MELIRKKATQKLKEFGGRKHVKKRITSKLVRARMKQHDSSSR